MATTRRHIPLWAAALLASSCLLAAPAHAADPKATFDEALGLFDAGDCEQALPMFERVFEATESPNARLYVARCLVQLDRLAAGFREMKGTVELARERAEQEQKYEQTAEAAAAELARLERRVGKVVVALADPEVEATLIVDGRELDPDEHGVSIPVDPGTVAITARAPGKKTVERSIELSAGETNTLVLTLPDAPPAPEPEPEEPPDEGGADFTALQWAGAGVGLLGVAGLVTFAVSGVTAKSRFDQLEEECGGVRCTDPRFAEVVDEGKSMQTVANVSVVVGGALLAGGVAMMVFGGADAEADAEEGVSASWGATPLPGGGYGGIEVRF